MNKFLNRVNLPDESPLDNDDEINYQIISTKQEITESIQ